MCRRGQIYDIDLTKYVKDRKGSSIQTGRRPMVVTQNNIGNKYSPTVLMVPFTTELKKINQPTHIVIKKSKENGLSYDSLVLCEQHFIVDKIDLNRNSYRGCLSQQEMNKIDMPLNVSMGTNKTVDFNYIEATKYMIKRLKKQVAKNNNIDDKVVLKSFELTLKVYCQDRKIDYKKILGAEKHETAMVI